MDEIMVEDFAPSVQVGQNYSALPPVIIEILTAWEQSLARDKER